MWVGPIFKSSSFYILTVYHIHPSPIKMSTALRKKDLLAISLDIFVLLPPRKEWSGDRESRQGYRRNHNSPLLFSPSGISFLLIASTVKYFSKVLKMKKKKKTYYLTPVWRILRPTYIVEERGISKLGP